MHVYIFHYLKKFASVTCHAQFLVCCAWPPSVFAYGFFATMAMCTTRVEVQWYVFCVFFVSNF